MDRRKVLLFAAAIVAALGTALVFLYVKGADNRAEERFETVEVLRAIAVIEPGEKIDEAFANGKLALQPVAQQDMLPTAVSSTESLSGLVATTRIYVGEQIIPDKFGGASEAASPLQIPKGQLAISVNLTDPARVAGFVNPGSEVAVFLNGSNATSGEAFTRVLLPRVTVLGVGSTTPTTTTTTTTDGAADHGAAPADPADVGAGPAGRPEGAVRCRQRRARLRPADRQQRRTTRRRRHGRQPLRVSSHACCR